MASASLTERLKVLFGLNCDADEACASILVSSCPWTCSSPELPSAPTGASEGFPRMRVDCAQHDAAVRIPMRKTSFNLMLPPRENRLPLCGEPKDKRQERDKPSP